MFKKYFFSSQIELSYHEKVHKRVIHNINFFKSKNFKYNYLGRDKNRSKMDVNSINSIYERRRASTVEQVENCSLVIWS